MKPPKFNKAKSLSLFKNIHNAQTVEEILLLMIGILAFRLDNMHLIKELYFHWNKISIDKNGQKRR